MKKIAAVDLGTNSIRLMLCKVCDNKFVWKSKEVITTRIGKNVDNTGLLNDKAIEKNIEAIKYFINTGEDDLEYVFGEKSFAFFFYKILNPASDNSFLIV